jgi:hypothetical protein
MKRVERMRLNPYQREEAVGRGKDHWKMAMGGRKTGWADYVSMLFKKGAKHPILGRYYTTAGLTKALLPPVGENKVIAEVNHNRWIAKCDCGGAEVVDPGYRIFYCFSCFNEETDGRAVKVKFPRQFDAIEKRLEVRENPYNRNWLVGESLEDLEDENEKHGLPRSKQKDNK